VNELDTNVPFETHDRQGVIRAHEQNVANDYENVTASRPVRIDLRQAAATTRAATRRTAGSIDAAWRSPDSARG
jgi:hypothetical protein